MADYIEQFTSPENIFNTAMGVSPSAQLSASGNQNGALSDVSSFIPDVVSIPSNIVSLARLIGDRVHGTSQPPTTATPIAQQPQPIFNPDVSQVPTRLHPSVTVGAPVSLVPLLTNIIRQKESSDNYQATNPRSTASGAYQYTDSTWNGYGGYAKAALAPPAVQDAKFKQDVHEALQKYGNPYKVIASHYLPALADDPNKWFKPFKVGGHTIKPVINYVRYVVQGTPLEGGLHDFIEQQQQNG